MGTDQSVFDAFEIIFDIWKSERVLSVHELAHRGQLQEATPVQFDQGLDFSNRTGRVVPQKRLFFRFFTIEKGLFDL